MALKVTKKGTKYAVVKESGTYSWDEYWYVVDIASGTKIKGSWTAAGAKQSLEDLESGFFTPDYYDTSWNSVFGEPIDMPDSLKKMQQQLINPTTKKKASKPIGSTSTSIVDVSDQGLYKILRMDDGTFGVYVPSTGESKLGLKTASGAKTSAKAMLKKHAGPKLSQMGVDPGSDAVDTLIATYEQRVRDAYGQAAHEMSAKQAKFMETFQKQREAMLQRLAKGEITKKQYKDWLSGQSILSGWYGEMVDSLSNDLVEADKNAMRMLNGYLPRAYAENMNYATYQIEGATNIDTGFALYNESTVARLLANPEGPLIPEIDAAKLNVAKDAVWSKQKISSSIMQSILQGETVDDAAKRLAKVVGMSANSAMLAARTALTAAQNLGRLDAGRRAKAMGIDLKKQWIATVDSRTRYSHREIDRETVELEEDFSNGCDCPGHGGIGSEVYNCRCAMRYVIPGHEYDDLPDVTKEGVAYDDWKNERQTKLAEKKDKIQAQYDEAMAKVNELQKLMPQDRDFNGIVQGGSKASQWTPEKVASSEEFYFGKLKKAIASDNQYDIDWYKRRLSELKAYDDAGRAYHEASKTISPQLERWKKVAADAKEKLKLIGGKNAYSSEAINNALSFVDKPWDGLDGKRECDKLMRPSICDAWSNATRAQRDAAYTYTTNDYQYYNRPLNGFDGSYRNYVGYGMVDLNNERYGKRIRELTAFLETCENPHDRWVRRGTDRYEMDTFFGYAGQDVFGTLDDDGLQALVGHTSRVGSFLSTGNCVGDSAIIDTRAKGLYSGSTGFGGEVDLQIFVPEGAQAAYAVPFSAFDSGGGLGWDGKSGQSSFGGENETILQRGGSYTCIAIERHGSRWLVKFALHPEDGYDTFQQ